MAIWAHVCEQLAQSCYMIDESHHSIHNLSYHSNIGALDWTETEMKDVFMTFYHHHKEYL